ncbi:MAG: phosphatase PAP2 family protein [Chlorobiales bacterium]|nr:phosphatase PAP2 family protein [Chlorobiales bacterium]
MTEKGRRYNRYFSCNAVAALFLVFLSVLPKTALAGDDKSAGHIMGDDATAFYQDFKHVFSAPAHYGTREWLAVGAVLGVTASALLVDEDIRLFARNNHTPFLDKVTPIGRYYGSWWFGPSLGTTLYLGGLAFNDPEVRLTGRAVIEAYSFSTALTTVLKVVLGRSRPYMNQGNMQYDWLEFEDDRWSIPSGHATGAFAISSVLSVRIDRPWATAGLYSLALVTVMNRIYDDQHWLSDTILGASIGTAVGITVGKLINEEAKRAPEKSPIVPAPLKIWEVKIAF